MTPKEVAKIAWAHAFAMEYMHRQDLSNPTRTNVAKRVAREVMSAANEAALQEERDERDRTGSVTWWK